MGHRDAQTLVLVVGVLGFLLTFAAAASFASTIPSYEGHDVGASGFVGGFVLVLAIIGCAVVVILALPYTGW